MPSVKDRVHFRFIPKPLRSNLNPAHLCFSVSGATSVAVSHPHACKSVVCHLPLVPDPGKENISPLALTAERPQMVAGGVLPQDPGVSVPSE